MDLLNLNLDSLHEPRRILICGDGDLSYSLALAQSLRENERGDKATTGHARHHHIVATCFLEGEELAATHHAAGRNATALRALGVIVVTGVDATQLEKYKGSLEFTEGTRADADKRSDENDALFDRIVWNFPQHPERKKIHRQRSLLREFFFSAGRVLRSDGQVWVTLKGGQGGSGAEMPEFRREYSNSWHVQENAAASTVVAAAHKIRQQASHRCGSTIASGCEAGLSAESVMDSFVSLSSSSSSARHISQREVKNCCSFGCGLVLVGAFEANMSAIAEKGYRSSGFRGSDRSFFTRGSIVHIFQSASIGAPVVFPLTYRHDISFWIHEPTFQEHLLRQFMATVFRRYAEATLSLFLSGTPLESLSITSLPPSKQSMDGQMNNCNIRDNDKDDGEPDDDVDSHQGVVSFAIEQFDAYVCPKTGRTSRGYHVEMWSTRASLTKLLSNDLMRHLSKQLCGEEGFKGGTVGSRYRYDLLPKHRGGDKKESPAPTAAPPCRSLEDGSVGHKDDWFSEPVRTKGDERRGASRSGTAAVTTAVCADASTHVLSATETQKTKVPRTEEGPI